MGNYISCALASPASKHNKSIKIISQTGEIKKFQQPLKAAELMLEAPNSFLVNSRSLQIGRRFSALNADEDLEMANVYVMFPMKRVRSVVTAADMGVLFLAANSATRRAAGGGVRVLPEPQRDEATEAAATVVPRLSLEDAEEFSTPEFKHRLSMCRSKKPLLETIVEEPSCL
ncbi:3-oxoacyl-[acyl-carrier-protein] synthase [Actinidia chinensis var. chinensis]|uniref:3-oxoacyl-[acyl-carrier-protein] synthase n=1 Tax=Actinidia chinensis var. chinensis TaxID=1590841 RepID=A0A2R6RKQ4_ACTCC|nr:3-oxoacyl-[acyl-carrier-protein] synthase [Actinidia chinensis var. chinensis]